MKQKKRVLNKAYIDETIKDGDGYSIYLSLNANKDAITFQSEIITKLAEEEGLCFIFSTILQIC